MTLTVKDIAAALGADAFGDTGLPVVRASEPQMAGPEDLALAMDPKYADRLQGGRAKAAVLWPGADWQALGLSAAIFPERPRFALSALSRMMDQGQGFARGIHPTAVIDDTAELAANVSVGPLAIISAGARIEAGGVIGPQCYIAADVCIGKNAYLREQVSIGTRVSIGDNFIAQPGARIGGDGFSFVTAEPSAVESLRKAPDKQPAVAPDATKDQSWSRIHSLGGVRIGDDVEIGMNATIDSGTIRDTCVGHGTKIDNLVHIGHNTTIGRNCLLCGQTGIAGSVQIGDNVVLAGQTGVSDNISIGDGVITGGATVLLSNVPAGRVMLGYPATRMALQIDSYKSLRRLPRLLRDVAALKEAVLKASKID